eukprot:m.403415 g.403415  ORF g.403415 m.403415 type:complete len:553 (+) comp21193_c1_seq2:416-2074(+)
MRAPIFPDFAWKQFSIVFFSFFQVTLSQTSLSSSTESVPISVSCAALPEFCAGDLQTLVDTCQKCTQSVFFDECIAKVLHESCTLRSSSENTYGWITVGFGALSLFACLLVLAVIFGLRKDQHDVRERIIVGLMCSNVSYSLSNLVPLSVVTSSCPPSPYVSSGTRGWSRGLWFLGAYMMVGYEMFILGFGIKALMTSNSRLDRRVERMAHSLCIFGGFFAFTFWMVWVNGTTKQLHTLMDEFDSHPSGSLTSNSTTCAEDAKYANVMSELHVLIDQYFARVRTFIRAWLGFLAMVVSLWVVSRVVVKSILREWSADVLQVHSGTHARGSVHVKLRLLQMRRTAYHDIERPLGRYVAVFAVFGVPGALLATDRCASTTTLGTILRCFAICEMILSLRSLATALVYFTDRQHRVELCNMSELLKLLWRRLTGLCGTRSRHNSGHSALFRNLEEATSQEFGDTLQEGLLAGAAEATTESDAVEIDDVALPRRSSINSHTSEGSNASLFPSSLKSSGAHTPRQRTRSVHFEDTAHVQGCTLPTDAAPAGSEDAMP